MKALLALYRRVQPVLLLVFVWCCMAAPALAGPKPGEEEVQKVGPSAWVLPYGLLIFSVGLGLMMVLRSARRAERHKPEQYASKTE